MIKSLNVIGGRKMGMTEQGSLRRLVTGIDGEGKSCVVADEMLGASDVGTVLFSFDPACHAAWAGAIGEDAVPPIEPPAGGSHAMIVSLPPVGSGIAPPDIPGIDGDGFHVTRTVDYVLVLEGTVELALDRETVTLSPGDIVVQQATNHAWRNPTTSAARFLVVLTSLMPRKGA